MSEEKPTAWAHLPNAAHIDRVIARVKANPAKWGAAWDAAWDAAWNAARTAAWDAARTAAWGAARDAAWGAARDAAWDAVRYAAWDAVKGAIYALIAWDEAGELMSQPPLVVKFFADEGVHAAVLLYPAVLAMQEDK